MPNQKLKDLLASMEEIATFKRFNKIKGFKPYDKQKAFFDLGATKRERMFMAGNQVGKTEAGAVEATYHATGEYPDWWIGKRFAHPTRAWVAGIKSVFVRDTTQKKLFGTPGVATDFGTGYIPKHLIVDTSLSRGVTDAYDTVQIKHKTDGVEDGVSTIKFKTYEEGRIGFQGDTLDWGWCDEEPDKMEVYSEFLTRLAPGGMLFTTFTPLYGQTELVDRFTKNVPPERGLINMTDEEALHFTEEERRNRFLGYASYERDARAKGIPLLGSGRVFTYDEELLKEDALDYIPPHWYALWGIDFGIGHPFAAVLILWDKDNDCIHVHHCIRMVGDEKLCLPIHHAAAMRPVGVNVPVAWPQDGTARDKGSGETISNLYKAQGLVMLPSHATFEDGSVSTEAGILEMEQRMATGRFKVARHLMDWFEEYRSYHRKDGQIVKERDDLMSATRVAVMMKRAARKTVLGGLKKAKPRFLVARDIDFDLS